MRRVSTMIPLLALLAYGCSGESSNDLAGSAGQGAGGDAGSGGEAGSEGQAGGAGTGGSAGSAAPLPYAIVDTAQVFCYGEVTATACPAPGSDDYGQDAQLQGNQPSYTVSSDGLTVHDNVTDLTWQRSPDVNGDGVLDKSDKLTYTGALARCESIAASSYGGFDDWRLPSIKELYSLILFTGTDPSGMQGNDTSGLTPFIDSSVFAFAYGDQAASERVIDSQYASSTLYVHESWLGDQQLFGVNFADGRIKGYDLVMQGGSEKDFFVQCVRGNPAYGINVFVDNGDQTVTDESTGLTWARSDSAVAMDWRSALAWVQARNAESYLGHDDWRLPNAKELQSILDYSLSPDTTQSAAIDPVFQATQIQNEDGQADYPWYWASTTHGASNGTGAGVYVAFGRAGGWQKVPPTASCYTLEDVHGAGAQRSDPKTSAGITVMGSACSGGTAYGFGPQGDAQRGSNFVRLVRSGATPEQPDAGPLPDASPPDQDGGPPPGDGGPPPGDAAPGPQSCNAQADCEAPGACPSSMGCECAQTPDGRFCVPKCNNDADCPVPPGMTLVCGPDGICIPG